MNSEIVVTDEEVKKYRGDLEKILVGRGYFLNPDDDFTNSLLLGILVNLKRYGYESCPCRLAADSKTIDIDIICPCYYRDDDVSEFGACYCALYVSQANFKSKAEVSTIPERRLKPKPVVRRMKMEELTISHTVWRCNVCGYLCSRDTAPDVCPICGAPKECFEVMIAVK